MTLNCKLYPPIVEYLFSNKILDGHKFYLPCNILGFENIRSMFMDAHKRLIVSLQSCNYSEIKYFDDQLFQGPRSVKKWVYDLQLALYGKLFQNLYCNVLLDNPSSISKNDNAEFEIFIRGCSKLNLFCNHYYIMFFGPICKL